MSTNREAAQLIGPYLLEQYGMDIHRAGPTWISVSNAVFRQWGPSLAWDQPLAFLDEVAERVGWPLLHREIGSIQP